MNQTADLDFERFEEFFDDSNEDGFPLKPSFDSEWQKCEVNNRKDIFLNFSMNFILSKKLNLFQNRKLHTNQAGVLVCVTDVISFLENPKDVMKFFIYYDIVTSESSTTTLTLNAGELEVTSKMIYDQDNFTKSAEIYKDLLAISSVTTKIDMIIHFEKQPKMSLHDFLKLRLGFSLLRDDYEINSVLHSHSNVLQNLT